MNFTITPIALNPLPTEILRVFDLDFTLKSILNHSAGAGVGFHFNPYFSKISTITPTAVIVLPTPIL